MMMTEQQPEWFAEWFDSPYYHILYGHRTYAEADAFVQKLMPAMGLMSGAYVLDLACGQGRHSRAMHAMGYRVTGVDLSPASIQYASQHIAQGLDFAVQDMRQLQIAEPVDAVVNLFTSFGYFCNPLDNARVLQRIYTALRPGGKLVIDYLNAAPTVRRLVKHEEQTHQGIVFRISRRVERGFVLKEIRFGADRHSHHYQEHVQLFTEHQLRNLLLANGFGVQKIWGSYDLTGYDPEHSPRMILLASR